jgi:hypothetical protein
VARALARVLLQEEQLVAGFRKPAQQGIGVVILLPHPARKIGSRYLAFSPIAGGRRDPKGLI